MLERLKKLMQGVDPEVNLDNITLETRLIDDLHFDSLGVMMLALAIEDEFNVTFDEPMNFLTVKDVVDYLEAHK
ncbi:MAG: acyl carrier protein [Erysipelotrichaceae bacterium]|jgi:acyl carrier protein|nr:acyl carrier protein [Erysipelotrichaceae bacterium]